MSVGVVRHDRTASAVTGEPGSAVYVVGSSTGRDGIHGATFASGELTEDSEEDRPSVQVGDPFQEKLLLEATLEVIKEELVIGVQDMGAAGLTSSAFEMSDSGSHGMTLHLDRVPVRETGMTPYEIMLSESQERMLIVCKPGCEDELEAVFAKWDLNAVAVGEVREDERVCLYWHGEKVADLQAEHLVLGGGAPVYEHDAEEPAYLADTKAFDPGSVPDVTPDSATDTLIRLLGSPNVASKRWVHEQYDTMVRTNTVVGPGPSDAAVVRVKGTDRGLAVKTDCNGRYVYLNPRRGAQIAVAEAARNVVCAGGEPLAITNCLNFGNPYKPEGYWTFKEAVAGMGDACRTFGTPVTGGNVSLYNEHPEGAVYPTPTIGMLGLVEDIEAHPTTADFKQSGDVIFVLQPEAPAPLRDIGGSEYLTRIHDTVTGDAPHIDLDDEKAVQQAMIDLVRAGDVSSAHDVSDGGLAVCLAESVLFSADLGAEVTLNLRNGERLDALLFAETQSRIVFSVPEDAAEAVQDAVAGRPVRTDRIGTVTGDGVLRVSVDGDAVIEAEHAALSQPHAEAIPSRMNQ
jgi:phosphoribosylformylglycinamidine synthase